MVLAFLALFVDMTSRLTLNAKPTLNWLVMERYDSIKYVVPVLGIGYLYNRVRARRFDPTQHRIHRVPFLDSSLLARVSIGFAVVTSLIAAMSGTVMAALGLFAGVMIASGAGTALKRRMVGMVNEKTQLLVALISALAILGGSWLASWASFSIQEFVFHGGYVAPALGMLAGLFLDLVGKHDRSIVSDAA